MNKLVFSLLILSHSIVSIAQSQSEEEKVKQTFNSYKKAILSDKGNEAVNYIDSKTLNYYNSTLTKVKNADSLALINMNRLDRFTVLAFRYKASKEEILGFNARSLLVYAINSGMVGKNSVTNNTIGPVNINGNTATGQLMVNDNATPFQLRFNKESGQWKVDITSAFPIAEAAFENMMKNSTMDENMFLMMILSMMSGDKPKNNIWNAVAG